MKKAFCAIILLFSIVISLVSCNNGGTTPQNNPKYKNYSKEISFTYFNTVSSISSYGKVDEKTFNSYVSIADALLGEYHKLFDIYYEYAGVSNLCTINKNAGKAPVDVDRELIDFLKYCKELYTLTGGKTNIMLGSVLRMWHDVREEALDNNGYLDPKLLPDADALRAASEHTSIDSLIIDEAAGTVYISDPAASIDVGAIAKGYAVDMLYERLVKEGADSVALNIGGNIRTIGLKSDNEKWVIGLTNPDKFSDEPLYTRVQIGSSSMVTSGDYERYFFAGDQKYHHIIDPVTLVPAAYFSSVTIITEHSGLADALSTALFCMTYEEGLALINSIGGVEVIWIDLDYNMITTPGIKTVPIE